MIVDAKKVLVAVIIKYIGLIVATHFHKTGKVIRKVSTNIDFGTCGKHIPVCLIVVLLPGQVWLKRRETSTGTRATQHIDQGTCPWISQRSVGLTLTIKRIAMGIIRILITINFIGHFLANKT